MARERLRNSSGQSIGYLEDTDAKIYAYSNAGKRLGYYDKQGDKTYDSSGRKIGTGNLLAILIDRVA